RRTVREVVAEFDGLSGSGAQKQVTSDAGLVRATTLEDLVRHGHMDVDAVARLLQAMQTRARTIKPRTLGVLGDDHLRTTLVQQFAVEPASVKYKKYEDVADGLPYVLELACGWYANWATDRKATKLLGVNFSPALRVPFHGVGDLFDQARI